MRHPGTVGEERLEVNRGQGIGKAHERHPHRLSIIQEGREVCRPADAQYHRANQHVLGDAQQQFLKLRSTRRDLKSPPV